MRMTGKFLALTMIMVMACTGFTGTDYVAEANTVEETSAVTEVASAGAVSVSTGAVTGTAVEAVEEAFEISKCQLHTSKNKSYVNVDVKHGVAPFKYEYTLNKISGKHQGTEYGVKNVKYRAATLKFPTKEAGRYELTVSVTDGEGSIATEKKSFAMDTFTIDRIKASQASPVVSGNAVTFKAICKNNKLGVDGQDTTWKIMNHGQVYMEKTIKGSTSFTWKEPVVGNYTIQVSAKDATGESAEYSMPYVVKEEEQNKAVIYYGHKNWTSANIHYKVGNGVWTTVPGVKMEASDIDGYTWEFDIDLGDAKKALVCFTNGKGAWDSNSGKNYQVETGTVGIGKGKITSIGFGVYNVKVNARKCETVVTTTVANGVAPYTYDVSVESANGKYTYSDRYVQDSNATVVNNYFSTHYSGDYEMTVKVTDGNGSVVTANYEFTIDPMAIEGVATKVETKVASLAAITFTADVSSVWAYYLPLSTNWTIEKDGMILVNEEKAAYTKSYTFTVSEAGVYKVTVAATDSSSDHASYTFDYEVTEKMLEA